MANTYMTDYQDQNMVLMTAGIQLADMVVNKNYLIHLDECQVVPFEAESEQFSDIRLFRITKIIHDTDEDAKEKLVSVYSSLGNFGSEVILVIKSTAEGVQFYIGAKCAKDSETAGVILEKSLKGNFQGINLTMLSTQEVEELLQSAVSENKKEYAFSSRMYTDRHVASVSVVPSMRSEKDDREQFVQGIEKLIDTMMGEEYTAVIIASPIGKRGLEAHRRGLEELYTTLAPFESISMTYGQNTSTSVTDSVCANFSSSINRSISNTTSYSESHSHGTSDSTGSSSGESWEGFFGFNHNSGTSRSHGTSENWGNSTSDSHGTTEGTGESWGESRSQSTSKTSGDSQSFTLTKKNKKISELLEKIEGQLKRIQECESFGLWESAAYFIAKDVQTAVVSANAYKAILTGEKSGVESSFVNLWDYQENVDTVEVLKYLEYCQHPRFLIRAEDETGYSPYLDQRVTGASMISGFELPLMMGLPKKSVTGVTAMNMADFGRNVFTADSKAGRKKINLGKIYHMGEKTRTNVALDLKSFSAHCFVCGSTGSGKSNTSYQLLSEMHRNGVQFMVVEPAKGEYRKALGGLEGLAVYTTNPQYFRMLKLNPFSFPNQIHVLEHLDRLIEIFTACWPLYAAMPAILKSAFEMAYIRCGWDLTNSIYMPNGRDKYPTFKDLLEVLPQIINESSYSSDSKGDYTGALVTRVSSLTKGITGQIFCDRHFIKDKDLFDRNVIVDLSRVGGQETKALIMGILVLKLSEYRSSTAKGENVPLKHVTVLEEAHNLLKRSGGGGAEGSDVQGKSVEMISSSIAEIRTFGEGFIIIDQSPSAVDISAIKNTNTKIVMRLPEASDCEAIGKAIGLTDVQIRELSRLGTGVAAVYQNNWLESCLVQVNMWKDDLHAEDVYVPIQTIRRVRGMLVNTLVRQYYANDFQLEELEEVVRKSDLPECKWEEYFPILEELDSLVSVDGNRSEYFGKAIRQILLCDQLLDLIGMKKKRVDTGKDAAQKAFRENLRYLDAAYNYLDAYGAIQTSRIRMRALLMIVDSWYADMWRDDQRVMDLWFTKNALVEKAMRGKGEEA